MKVPAVFVLLATMLVAVYALPFYDHPSLPTSNPHSRRFPNFPGYGSFNPKHRYARSGGSVSVDQPVNGPASVTADMNQRVYENEHGHISVYGHGHIQDGGRPQGNAGVHAEFHWGDGADGGGGMSDAARMAEIDRIRKELKID